MAVHHRLTTDEPRRGPGRPVLVKQADTPGDAARLRREAELLRAAAHPGVVAVVFDGPVDDGYELHLAVAGSRTVADLRTDLDGVAGLIAALAATVADLHDLGIVHGRIRAEHVVVDGSGRPVLCGFGDAGRVGTIAPGGVAAPAAADDVAGLGSLLAELTAGVDSQAPAARRLPVPGRRPRPWSTRRSLLALAEQAVSEDPARRPSARAFAASVLAVLPAARLPSAASGQTSGDASGAGRRRLVAPMAAAVGVGLLAFGIGGLVGAPPFERSQPGAVDPPAPPLAATTTATSPTTAIPTTATTATTATTVGAPAAAAAAPAVVEHDGVRYGVGQTGDLIVVGDWDCDGHVTMAVVRPGSGEVFVFDDWAVAGRRASAALTATVVGAAAVAPEDGDGDGCPDLVVADEAGRRVTVPT